MGFFNHQLTIANPREGFGVSVKKRGLEVGSVNNLLGKADRGRQRLKDHGEHSTKKEQFRQLQLRSAENIKKRKKKKTKESGTTCLTKLSGGTATRPPLLLSRATEALLAIG